MTGRQRLRVSPRTRTGAMPTRNRPKIRGETTGGGPGMFSWFSRALQRHSALARSRRHRPHLEALEARALLNNRFVVPVGVPPDNVNTFGTLRAALTTPGVSA